MPSAIITQHMCYPSWEVFSLLHDYSRRLEWDTMLCEARLTQGHEQAAKGATSLCVGKFFWGLIGIETRYVSFTPDSLAAVEMINKPPFFAEFAASIRHVDLEEGGSTLTYKLRFVAKPRCLRWLLHPIMSRVLRYETQKRLKALSDYLNRREWEAKTETGRLVGPRWGQSGNIDSPDV